MSTPVYEYPSRPFSSIDDAQSWVADFVRWYNEDHHHSSIQFVTPAQRHRGEDADILSERRRLYEAARARRPERWTTRTRAWRHIDQVTLNPRRDAHQQRAAA